MGEVEAYIEKLLSKLYDMNFFLDEENPFMDAKIFKQIVREIALRNFEEVGDPILTDEQFEAAIEKTMQTTLADTLNDLVADGRVVISGINENGEFLYSLPKK